MNFVVVREKKKLFSVKTRLERNFREPWLATTFQPRHGTFALVDAWVDVMEKDVEHLFVSPRKNIKFCFCVISKDSKFKSLVQKVIGASSFPRIHSGKSRKRCPAVRLKIFPRKLPQTLPQPAGLMRRVRIVLVLPTTTVATM